MDVIKTSANEHGLGARKIWQAKHGGIFEDLEGTKGQQIETYT